MKAEQTLTVDDVAGLARLHPEVVRRAIRRGELRASRLCGRLRVTTSDYHAWLKQSQMQTAGA
jgi:excisionase family DNA binding protein